MLCSFTNSLTGVLAVAHIFIAFFQPQQCPILFFLFLQQYTGALRQGLQIVYIDMEGYTLNEQANFHSYEENLESILVCVPLKTLLLG